MTTDVSSGLRVLVKFLNWKVSLFALQLFLLHSLQEHHYVQQTPREQVFLFSFLSTGTIMQSAKTCMHGRVRFSPLLINLFMGSWNHRCLFYNLSYNPKLFYFVAQNFQFQILETLLIGSVLMFLLL